jgi:hypothetical protein
MPHLFSNVSFVYGAEFIGSRLEHVQNLDTRRITKENAMSLDISPSSLETPVAPAKPCCQKRAQAAAAASAPATAFAPAKPAGRDLAAFLHAYQPVLTIAGAALAGSLMLGAAGHGADAAHRMQSFMGLFLLPLALLKLFDIGGFASAFARYDVVARAWRPYGFVYPFVELALALFFLAGLLPVATNVAAVVIGGLGTIGIVQTLARGDQVRCACVGSTLNVPLGTVSILENAGMALMAAAMLAL